MKFIITLILSFVTYTSFAQDTVLQYLSYDKTQQVEEYSCYFVRKIMKNGMMWDVKDYYAKEGTLAEYGSYLDDSLKIEHGSFVYYHKNGKLAERGRYNRGKKNGLWWGLNEEGLVDDSSYYVNGIPVGFSYKGPKGDYSLIGLYDISGNGTGHEWGYYDYSNNKLSFFGKYSKGYNKDSIWTYYYNNGLPSLVEEYVSGKLITFQCYDTLGKLQRKDCKTGQVLQNSEGITKSTYYHICQFLRSIKLREVSIKMALAVQ